MVRIAVLTMLLAVGPPRAAADPAEKPRRPCKEHPAVSAPCFQVHGRLSLWNGAPAARIWVVGTKRVLGVSDGQAEPGYEQMPSHVRERLTWDVILFGDYEFCPFTPDEPGVMRLGCIQSGSRLRAERR